MHCPSLRELPVPPSGQTGWPWTEGSESLPERMPDGREWPRITVVTPSFNQGHFIEETITVHPAAGLSESRVLRARRRQQRRLGRDHQEILSLDRLLGQRT